MKKVCILLVLIFNFSFLTFNCIAQGKWSLNYAIADTTLNAVYATSVLTAYVVGDTGFVIKTSNGGSSWLRQNSHTLSDLNTVYFFD